MSKTLRGRLLAAIFCAGAVGAYAAPVCAETLADAIALAYPALLAGLGAFDFKLGPELVR